MTRPILIILFILLLAPVYWMFTGSLQDSYGVFLMPPRIFPRSPTLENYGRLLGESAVPRWVLNTAMTVGLSVILSVGLSVSAGYAFAFYQFPVKRLVWMFLLAGIMVPRISVVVPLFVVINQLQLSGTLAAVILATGLSPVGMFLARTYFESVPKSVLESARIDGANEAEILARIVVPISRPIVTALALFASIASLQDYMWQMLILQRPNVQTLLVGLTRAIMTRGGTGSGTNLNPIGQALAAGVILLLPLIVIFAVANKYFTTVLGGAEK